MLSNLENLNNNFTITESLLDKFNNIDESKKKKYESIYTDLSKLLDLLVKDNVDNDNNIINKLKDQINTKLN